MQCTKSGFTGLMILALLTATAHAHTSGGIVIKDAWIREGPPNTPVLAAYLTIENHTDADKVLTTVSSSQFVKIEIHNTIHKDGMASMVEQKELVIPAQGEVKFVPGGMHLMLINPSTKLKTGDSVSFTLKFANGSTSIVSMPVKKASSSEQHAAPHDHKNQESREHEPHNH